MKRSKAAHAEKAGPAAGTTHAGANRIGPPDAETLVREDQSYAVGNLTLQQMLRSRNSGEACYRCGRRGP